MTPKPDRYLEVSVVAMRLKKCPETIRRYIRRGLLPATRLPGTGRGGNYLIAESALQPFLHTTSCDTPNPNTP